MELNELDAKEQSKVAREKFNELYKKNGDSVYITNRYGDKINIPTAVFKEIKNHSADTDVLSIITSIPDLLEQATYLYSTKSDPKRNKHMMYHVTEYKTYGAQAKIRYRYCYLKIVVRTEENKRYVLHDIDINDKKIKDETSNRGYSRYKQEPGSTSSSFVKNSIPWWLMKSRQS